MSDPTIEEDSLISQEDIDKLLNSSSIEEAEEKLSSNDADMVDELGELSQDDIDNLMNSTVSKAEDSVDEDGNEEDDLELISQDDIDQLMNSSVSSDKDVTESSGNTDDAPEEELGELSQDDIDRLMNSSVSDPEDSTEEELDQPDESVIVEEIKEPAGGNDSTEDEYIIEESEAVDVQDCLVAQETIDDLIQNFGNEETSEPVILDEDPVPEPDPVVETDESNEPEDTVLDDTEDFLKPDSDVTLLDFDDEGGEDVSQEDIDALLLEPDDDDDGDDEDDILVSQDDIDTLLMAADQEDEDVLGNLTDNEFDSSLDDELEEEDLLENESFDDEEENNADQVVLEGDDDEPVVKQEKKKRKAGSQWYKSKLVIACASALVVLGITVPLTYFILFSDKPDKGFHPDPVTELTATIPREIEIETVDVNVRKPVIDKNPGNMILKDFVVLASDASKDMAYVTADISIDYSDQRAYHEIMNNLSFYRDLIYDSINKSLVSGKRDQITQADILWIIETNLKKVLPGHYIDRVSFKSFKTS